MNNYVFRQLNKDLYYIICLDCNSILNYLDEVENEYCIEFNEGMIIIDQLLVTGNGKNRFISCQFSHGKIELGTAQNIEGSYEYKKIATELLVQFYNELKYSILTDSQWRMIQEGHVI